MITPITLLILDGWGIPDATTTDSVAQTAHTPFLRTLLDSPTVIPLRCHGSAVGLDDAYTGNSEVGHLTIGSGRVILQDYMRIQTAIDNGTFFSLPSLTEAIVHTKKLGGRLHCMGLFSDSAVHAHIAHFFACIQLAREYSIPLYFHLFTDGRDTAPYASLQYLTMLFEAMKTYDDVHIATLMGRYFAMDRDKRWERTAKAYTCMVHPQQYTSLTPYEYVQQAHEQGITDEFIEPVCFSEDGVIKNGDAVFFLNFRADRARQLTQAFYTPSVLHDTHTVHPCAFISITPYATDLPTTALFTKEEIRDTLGDVLEQHRLSQFRIAETEKYAHVTYFFNGGRETPSSLEERLLIPSPKHVPTYDLQPEMSADAVTKALVTAIRSNKYALHVCNFANLDMVGHTGIPTAVKKAYETIDTCIHTIYDAVKEQKGILIITADHGNAEAVQENALERHTSHTHNRVPCIIVLPEQYIVTHCASEGTLADIAPTILQLLGLQVPDSMTGKSLIAFHKE